MIPTQQRTESTDTPASLAGAKTGSTASDPMVVFSLRLPKVAADQLRDVAAAHGRRPTELAREWVSQGIAGLAAKHR